MALDATIGGSSADTYGSIVEADAYWDARQATDWGGDDATAKEYALRKAAAYLDGAYRGKWKGQRVNRDQSLAWPRAYAIDSDGYSFESDTIPQALKNAQFEAAKIILGGTELADTIDRAVKMEKIGSLAVEYSDGATVQAQYPQITYWLSDLVSGGASVNGTIGNGSIVRA